MGCWLQHHSFADAADMMLSDYFDYGKNLPDWLKSAVGGLQSILPVQSDAPEWMETLFEYLIRRSPGMWLGTELTKSGAIDGPLSFFNFVRDEQGVFHVTPHCWQQYGGYCDFYDYAFDVGTSMRKQKYTFTSGGEDYAIWMWKGDYLNLGAGAETAIYTGGEPLWEIDTSLALPMTLTLTGQNGNDIFDYHPDEPQWWITGFNPAYQRADASTLNVTGTIDFSAQENLYQDFKKSINDQDPKVKAIFDFDDDKLRVTYHW